jgi:hypothetical protein
MLVSAVPLSPARWPCCLRVAASTKWRREHCSARGSGSSLVRAGMLGAVAPVDGGFEAHWTDAVRHGARHQAGGLRFRDVHHSYATWLVDDRVPHPPPSSLWREANAPEQAPIMPMAWSVILL